MSNLKEIRRRISSVKNTKQITRAMKLVSAAKLRRAQDAAVQGRAFAQNLQSVTARLAAAISGEFSHPLFENREVKKRRVLVIAGERGLCGPFNSNLIKTVLAEESSLDVEREFVVVGKRAVSAAHKYDWNAVKEYEGLPEDVAAWPLIEIIDDSIASFRAEECDEVVVYYTKFLSAMTQTPSRDGLLPFSAVASEEQEDEDDVTVQIKFDPSPDAILENVVPLFLQTKVAQAAFESKASEHAARMTAMDSATRNADDLIDKLVLHYNRARQSAITKELLDIVGGAEALQG